MTHVYIPPWLEPQLGTRERAILEQRDCKTRHLLEGETDDARLPRYQQHLESKTLGAHFTIDSQQRRIIG